MTFCCVSCFIKVKLSVKVKLFVLLICVCAILPVMSVAKMTYTVSGGMLNPTHSLTHSIVPSAYVHTAYDMQASGTVQTLEHIPKKTVGFIG